MNFIGPVVPVEPGGGTGIGDFDNTLDGPDYPGINDVPGI